MSSFAAPADVLPHRPPFLFVDRISALDIGKGAIGHWKLHGDEWFFPGHFPGRPTLPGVLMCEAIAQVGAYAVLSDPAYSGKLPLFGASTVRASGSRWCPATNSNWSSSSGA